MSELGGSGMLSGFNQELGSAEIAPSSILYVRSRYKYGTKRSKLKLIQMRHFVLFMRMTSLLLLTRTRKHHFTASESNSTALAV